MTKMETKKLHGKTALAAALFAASAFIIGIKLLNPATIQVILGDDGTVIKQIPGLFTFADAAVLVAASVMLGLSGMYLLVFEQDANNAGQAHAGQAILAERKCRWEETAKTLKDDEQEIYNAIIDAEGIVNQSELVEKTGISKSNISRALDLLESKGIVEKRRRGMGNVVLLK